MGPQSALAPLRRWDPERIGPFALLGRLGAGAMGQVYLGRSTAGRLVAVKTIKIEFAEESGFRSRFAHEVAAARRVSGVFTAAVVAADADADVPWLATAYIAAPSLNRLVRSGGPLPVPGVRWLAAGCAEALESIHHAGLVHRDLKPSNVLVSPDGPRVIDFGVARAAERIQLTVTRGALGTPAYMAPEQARDTRQASVASDMFSLGATLLFAATGHPPYLGDTVMDVLVRLATEAPDLTGLPAELIPVVTACLERSPRNRPTSTALLAELAPFVGATASPGSGHSYLPASALTLIGEYQRSPQPPPEAGPADDQDPPPLSDDVSEDASEDGTFGSYTALPAPRRSRWPRRRGDSDGPGPPAAAPGPGAGRRRRKRIMAGGGLLAGAVALLAAGAALGASFPGGTGQAPASRGTPTPTATDAPSARQSPGPPPGLPPPLPSGTSTRPKLAMGQYYGDGDTVFVVHGSGFVPGTHVQVRLIGHGVAPFHPTADQAGTFNYAIDQGHVFFAGPIPAGTYHVLVTGARSRQATATFQVRPVPPPPTGRPLSSGSRSAPSAQPSPGPPRPRSPARLRPRRPAPRRTVTAPIRRTVTAAIHETSYPAGLRAPESTTGPPGGSTTRGR
jgi:serine/threonine protein kinase